MGTDLLCVVSVAGTDSVRALCLTSDIVQTGLGEREEDEKCRNPFRCMTYREISQTPRALESGMRAATHWKKHRPSPI